MSAMSTVSPGYFYKPPLSDRLNERKDSMTSSVSNKSIENPLLDRDPPPLVAMNHHQQNETTTTTPTFAQGMRQRRPQQTGGGFFREDKENNATILPPRGGSYSKPPPPRASASLGTAMEHTMALSSPAATTGTGGDLRQQSPFVLSRPPRNVSTPMSNELALVPSTTNCWVLVFGYATADQYEELLHRFSTYGHVLHHRGLCQPGQSNWIAIQYANELEAKKALCHSTVQLSGSIYCGVKPLADDDPILLHRHDPMSTGLFGRNGGQRSTTNTATTTQQSSGGAASNGASGWTENDILLHGHRSGSGPRENDPCTRIMRWVLGIPSNLE